MRAVPDRNIGADNHKRKDCKPLCHICFFFNTMKYARGVLYPHDGDNAELERLLIPVDLTGFDIRKYCEQMIDMPIYVRYVNSRQIGKCLDAYVDKEGNLCIFFRFSTPEEGLTHLQICYRLQSHDDRCTEAFDFSCCLSDESDVFFKSCTFQLIDLKRRKHAYLRDNLLLTL